MPEQFKKWYHQTDQRVSAGAAVSIDTAFDSSTQGIVTGVSVTAGNLDIDFTVDIKNGLETMHSYAKAAGEKLDVTLEGAEKIYQGETFSVEVSTGVSQRTLPRIFYQSNSYHRSAAPSVQKVPSTTEYTLDEFEDLYTSASEGWGQIVQANDVCPFIHPATGEQEYLVKQQGNSLCKIRDKDFNYVRDLTLTSSASCRGITSDGTYFYGIVEGVQSQVKRWDIDGNETILNIVGGNVIGRYAAQFGLFALHANKLYTSGNSSDTTISVIDLADMTLTTLSVTNLGAYGIGYGITVAENGTPYLVHIGTNGANWINLNDHSVGHVSHSVTASTQYGNHFAELAPGLVLSRHNANEYILDMNGMPSMSTRSGADRFLDGYSWDAYTVSVGSPVQTISTPTTYSAKIEGVEITGVS